jgi:hypothetical protein
MSIPLHLHTCHLGSGRKKKFSDSNKNAFRKLLNQLDSSHLGPDLKKLKEDMEEDVEVPDDPGLTESEKKAVKELLDQHKSEESSAGPYADLTLEFPDGGVVEIWAFDLDKKGKFEGMEFSIWKVTAQAVDLLFNLSQSGNQAIIPGAQGVDPWVTSTKQKELVSTRWPNAKVISSAAQLQTELEKAAPVLEVED